MRGCAAIDRDDDPRTVCFEAQQSRRIRAIAFAHPVGDIDRGMRTDGREETQQQRSRCCAVDIVIAKHDDRLAVPHGAQQARDSTIHVAQMQRVRQPVAQPRRQKSRRFINTDAALREQASDDFR